MYQVMQRKHPARTSPSQDAIHVFRRQTLPTAFFFIVDAVTEAYRFCCNRCTVSGFIFRQSFCKTPSGVCPAATHYLFIICITAVAYQETRKAFEKFSRMNAASHLLVFKNNDAAVIHFSIAVDPHLRIGCCFTVRFV